LKEHLVALNIITNSSISRDALISEFNAPNLMLVHRELEDGLMWIVESQLDVGKPLLDHINYLISVFDHAGQIKATEAVRKIYMNIGVIYDTASCTVALPNEVIQTLLRVFPDLNIEITCYPSNE